MSTDSSQPPIQTRGAIIRAALILAVLYGLTMNLQWGRVEQFLAQTNWREFWLIVSLYGVVQLIRTLRFYLLAPSTPFGKLCFVSALHVFYLRILPFRAGELAYAVLLKKHGLGSAGRGIAHLAFTRFQDMAVVGTIALLGIAFTGTSAYGFSFYVGSGVIICISLACLIFLANMLGLAGALIHKVVPVFPGKAKEALRRLSLHLEEAGKQVSALSPQSRLTSTAITVALWAAAFGVMYYSMLAIGLSTPLGMLMLAGSITIVASFIPVGVVGTFGILEAGWVIGFSGSGATQEEAVAGAIVYSFSTLVAAGMFAFPSWLALSRAPSS